MYCFQCQETAAGKGCTVKGVCGKTEDVANLQDLLMYLMKGVSELSVRLRESGEEMPEVDKFVTDGLFMTITNVNFDKQRFVNKIEEAFRVCEKVRNRLVG
ncbi:MAG: hydroxylamine reductase, partial [Dysgonamonadaceae bacterium]|nr:hydroxylamine reductase [Dysgonamonadaceae bacterium]